MDVEMPTVETIRKMVQRNEGVAFLPRMCVEQDIAQDMLREVRVKELDGRAQDPAGVSGEARSEPRRAGVSGADSGAGGGAGVRRHGQERHVRSRGFSPKTHSNLRPSGAAVAGPINNPYFSGISEPSIVLTAFKFNPWHSAQAMSFSKNSCSPMPKPGNPPVIALQNKMIGGLRALSNKAGSVRSNNSFEIGGSCLDCWSVNSTR